MTRVLAAALLAASLTSARAEEPASPPRPTAKPQFGAWGVDLTARDLSVKPGQDFNQHANGAWEKATEIPADKAEIGGFIGLYDLSQEQLQAIVEDLGKAGGKGEAVLVGALYRSFMDEGRLEKLDDRPLQKDLKRVQAATSRAAQARLMGDAHGRAGGTFFGVEVQEDLKDPTRSALYVGLAGLGLPDRDYYQGEGFAPVRTAYQAYLEQVLTSARWPRAKQAAAEVWALEQRIAAAHWTRAEKRQVERIYNPMTLAELEAHAPGFPWRAWAEGAGVAKLARFVVIEKDAFPAVAKIFAETPLPVLQAWQAAQTTDQASPFLSRRFVEQRFAFRGKLLQGQPADRPRAKRGVQLVDMNLGDALGKVYVARHFPPSSKAAMEALVADLRTAMKARIERLEWMTPETRAQALAKLARFGVKIGYPATWRDYSALRLDRADLFGNVVAAGKFNHAWSVGKLAKPNDPAEWGMTPQTVNAYYNPVRNEIVFPAAILQPPFFDPAADPAVNYGAIGAVIGHEITHGFDDQGRKSDGDGMMRDWWTAEDAARFEARAGQLAAQYSAIEVLPGAKVNGALTLGENIADQGGILLGFDAWRLSLKGQPAPVLDGLTGAQRLFYGWAQVWRSRTREALARQRLVVDTHTPTAVRARAPVRNVDAWYEAFGVQPGDADYLPPEQRVRIW